MQPPNGAWLALRVPRELSGQEGCRAGSSEHPSCSVSLSGAHKAPGLCWALAGQRRTSASPAAYAIGFAPLPSTKPLAHTSTEHPTGQTARPAERLNQKSLAQRSGCGSRRNVFVYESVQQINVL